MAPEARCALAGARGQSASSGVAVVGRSLSSGDYASVNAVGEPGRSDMGVRISPATEHLKSTKVVLPPARVSFRFALGKAIANDDDTAACVLEGNRHLAPACRGRRVPCASPSPRDHQPVRTIDFEVSPLDTFVAEIQDERPPSLRLGGDNHVATCCMKDDVEPGAGHQGDSFLKRRDRAFGPFAAEP